MVVVIESNIVQVRKFLEGLPSNMEKITTRTIKRTVKEGKAMARMFAPEKTGALKAGIVASLVNKREGKIVSSVNKSYKYNMWVEGAPGYEVIRKDQLFEKVPGEKFTYYNTKQPLFAYGDKGALSSGGNPIKWTGQHGFFTKTFRLIDSKFFGFFGEEIRKELERGA